jgi:VWFA-related protein
MRLGIGNIKRITAFHMETKKIILSILTIFLLLGNFALTQESKKNLTRQEEIPQPTYEVEVVVTNVDVVVTDKDGNHIIGLKPENFEIYEDNYLQKLTNFYEVKGLEIYASVQDKEKATLSVPPHPLPEKSPRFRNKIIIYFDNWHLHPLNRNWSIKKLESFIKNNFSTEDSDNQGMIVCLGQKLEIIQEFTSSPGQLLQAIKETKKYSGQSLLRKRTKEDLRKELNRIISDSTQREDRFDNYDIAMSYARNYVEAEQIDLIYSLKSMNAFMDYLTGIEGKKILIYVSDGLPINPSEEVFSFIDQAFPRGKARVETMNYDATRLFKELAARCNANEITLYPINAQGLESMILSADKEAGWDFYSRGSGMVKPTSRVRNDALQLMAHETGGLAVLNTNDIESGLKRIRDDLQFYYSLGYRSPSRDDNKYHSIQVKLVGVDKKYNVRVRRGYAHISEEAKIEESVLSRLFLKRSYNPMNIRVQILPLKPMPGTKKLCLTLKILIPIKNLALIPQKDGHAGQIKAYIALMDAEGQLSPCHKLTEQVLIPAQDYETALNSNYPYLAEMYVDPSSYTISLAVKDVPGDVLNYIQLEKTIQ